MRRPERELTRSKVYERRVNNAAAATARIWGGGGGGGGGPERFDAYKNSMMGQKRY